ncbi:MAG: PadR family transcriptional regulator [Candidatus Aminicenantales bacterium]
MNLLSRSEEIVLLAVWQLRDNAYGVTIRTLVSKAAGYPWSIGAVYAPLYRLERKGLVRMIPGEPTPERGGRSKVYYRLTPDGKKSLLRTKRVHDVLWGDAQPIRVDEI